MTKDNQPVTPFNKDIKLPNKLQVLTIFNDTFAPTTKPHHVHGDMSPGDPDLFVSSAVSADVRRRQQSTPHFVS